MEIGGCWVDTALLLPEVDQDTERIEILGMQRPALAIVTHKWDIHNPEARMMNWIPEIKKPPSYNTPESHILNVFGIYNLENFEYLGRRILVREPIPATVAKMNLGFCSQKWTFEGYNRRNKQSFNRLRETLWAIAMLPRPVIEKALNEGHFLLVNEMIGEEDKGGKEEQITAMATITRGTDIVLVEDFSGRQTEDYGEGYIERDTPVVVLRYH